MVSGGLPAVEIEPFEIEGVEIEGVETERPIVDESARGD